MAGFYAVYHGPEGIRTIAERIHSIAVFLEESINRLGYKQVNAQYFDTLRFALPDTISAQQIRTIALSKEVNLRYFKNGDVGMSIDETTDITAVNVLLSIFAIAAGRDWEKASDVPMASSISAEMKRQSTYLTHEVFNKYHTETEMMRYIKRLDRKDISLAHSMISLGSCTMKLNAAAEMLPLSRPEFIVDIFTVLHAGDEDNGNVLFTSGAKLWLHNGKPPLCERCDDGSRGVVQKPREQVRARRMVRKPRHAEARREEYNEKNKQRAFHERERRAAEAVELREHRQREKAVEPVREQTEQQHQRKEEREEQRGLHDGLDEQVRRPLRRGNGGIGHALCHAVDGVVGDAKALERVERFAEQIAQLVGQQSAGAQVAVLRGQRVGRNVALKLLKHSLLHLGVDEVGDRPR